MDAFLVFFKEFLKSVSFWWTVFYTEPLMLTLCCVCLTYCGVSYHKINSCRVSASNHESSDWPLLTDVSYICHIHIRSGFKLVRLILKHLPALMSGLPTRPWLYQDVCVYYPQCTACLDECVMKKSLFEVVLDITATVKSCHFITMTSPYFLHESVSYTTYVMGLGYNHVRGFENISSVSETSAGSKRPRRSGVTFPREWHCIQCKS